ncbi:MAG: TIGR03905 family TSCPD domain-containing protein [Oscillospiraceae bacterium]|nr:TIGR03905 family TSCPD domain-containing protein [Oscillospiraceae bacterium]
MTKHTYVPRGVCSRKIEIELDGNVIKRVDFIGGCAGNTQGVARLVEGMTVQEAVTRLEGIECGFKGTSCPDQLAKALIQALSGCEE